MRLCPPIIPVAVGLAAFVAPASTLGALAVPGGRHLPLVTCSPGWRLISRPIDPPGLYLGGASHEHERLCAGGRDGARVAGSDHPGGGFPHSISGDGDLMLWIAPRGDGTSLVVDVRSLTAALAEVGRALAVS
jgi:hypothetical protein